MCMRERERETDRERGRGIKHNNYKHHRVLMGLNSTFTA